MRQKPVDNFQLSWVVQRLQGEWEEVAEAPAVQKSLGSLGVLMGLPAVDFY